MSAASTRSSMCVATYFFKCFGIILCRMVDETCGNDDMPKGETVQVYGVAKEAWLMAMSSFVFADVGIW